MEKPSKKFPKDCRPAEVGCSCQMATKQKKLLVGPQETSFKDLIKMMVEYDLSK